MNSSDAITKRRGLDNRIPPPVLFLVTALAMGAASAMLPPSGLGGPWTSALGVGLALLAALTGPPAIFRFRRVGTTINPVEISRASTLVTDGVYRWSRNPMYVSMAALLGAIAAFTAQLWLITGVVAFVLFITRFQILPEEKVMRLRFGAPYEAYCRQVRRWL